MNEKIVSKRVEDTLEIGKIIAKNAFCGEVVTLSGDLGAGKTTLTKGVGNGLGIEEEINSPTFNILKCYFHDPLPLYHIDAYRLEGVRPEQKNIGLEEIIEGNGVTLIEWPMYIEEFIPFDSLSIEIHNDENGNRTLLLSSNSPKYFTTIKELKEKFGC